MAVNKPKGDNARKGAVKKRSQLKTKIMGEEKWTKRSKKTGEFMDQKEDGKKFKGVRKEKKASAKKSAKRTTAKKTSSRASARVQKAIRNPVRRELPS